MKAVLLTLGAISILILLFFIKYVSIYDYGATVEQTIKAQYKDMENILGQYSLKVTEAVQLPNKKVEDLSKVVKEAMSGRYGNDGSKATFQWITENYPGTVSDEMYVKVQQIIESGRNKFENSQTKFIDIKRSYETELNKFFSGFFLKIAGYPKIDLKEYDIISSEHASDTFNTKIDKGLKL
jgi:hypothetical protein